MTMANVCITAEECPTCHIIFWLTQKHHSELVNSKERYICPNGHGISYVGKSSEEKLRDAERKMEALREYWNRARERTEEYRNKWKGCQKKLKKLSPPDQERPTGKKKAKKGEKKK